VLVLQRRPLPLFLASASAVLIVCIAITRTRLFATAPDVAAWGVTFDLTITIPLLYYLFVVRSGRAAPLTLAPLFIGCMALASTIVPKNGFLHDLRFLAAPLDILLIAVIARRVWRHEPLLGDGRVAAFVTSEAAMMTYALAGWRMKRDVPPNSRAVSIHERSGWGSVVACIIVLIASESIGVHLFVSHWSTRAAWVFTAMDIWAVLWILGDSHALRLRPTLVSANELLLRAGMRWTVSVPLNDILAIEPIPPGSEWKRRGVLKVALLDEPRLLIRFREPLIARGIAGITKKIDAVAILPDDPGAFDDLAQGT
ncbi:MAG: hypothetical protein ACXV5L_08540, partial [Thermoanaerobaculia bacterium]